MAIHYKTQGFVFKKSDLNESDRFFSVFTSDFGRLEIFAKAIRKLVSKLRNGIDIFFISDIEFIQGKNRKTLTNAVTIEKFGKLALHPEKFKVANAIGKILDNFIKGEEKDEKIFGLIHQTFSKLNNLKIENCKLKIVYYYFLWSFLSLLGYKPEVDKCNICHTKLNPYNIYFSDKLGGIICKKCLTQDNPAVKINSDIVKILRLIFKKEWNIVSKLKIAPASQKLFKKISDNYCS